KINLNLHVGPLRPDGFHEVRTLLQSIAVADTLVVSGRRGPFAITAHAPGLATDETNIVWRAAAALWRAIGRDGEPRDAHIKLDKQIPMAAGLGGGSADAAAALAGLNDVWVGRQSREQLMRLGAGLGSDVPFFLSGGTALGVGRGDELYPVDDLARVGVILIKPSFGVSTPDAYRWLDEDRAQPEGRLDADRERRALDVGWSSGPAVLVNDLEAPVARRHPAIVEMIRACERAGALAAAMTGSGSVVFGVFPEASARKAAKQLERPDWRILLTRTLSRREAGRRLGL
ncbi:MAG: 4-(cytidine 5'-diphospho)-2-C-methyl-D-erythritol kinase, partial [Acidobacteriota bacterium]